MSIKHVNDNFINFLEREEPSGLEFFETNDKKLSSGSVRRVACPMRRTSPMRRALVILHWKS